MYKVSNNKKSNRGFTLVELIIVIAIIAILAAVLAPQYLQYVERSRQSNDLQVATNLMRAVTVAVADPQSNVPAGCVLEVLWATGGATRSEADQEMYGGKLYIRSPQTLSRVSVLTENGATGINDASTLQHLQEMIFGIMGVEATDVDFTGTGAVGMLEDAQSVAGNSASFSFHVHTSTGEIALAKFDEDGDVNVWAQTIGVDATLAP